MGLRLRDWPSERLSWRDLYVICHQAPVGSAIWRSAAEHPDRTHLVDLARQIEFDLRVLAWQGTEDGQRGRNYPEPIVLPWDPAPEGSIRGDVMEWDEALEWLGWAA